MDFLKQATQNFGGSGAEANLLQQAEGFLGSQQSSSGQPTTHTPAAGSQQPAAPGRAPPPGDLAAAATAPGSSASGNYGQVYSSAETLYQGLSNKFTGKQSNIDDQQLAGAAANVLQAAEESGYVKDSQYGQYFDKAESYLQNYSSKHSGAPTSGAPAAGAGAPPPNPYQ